jgi:phage tail-like protein
METASYVISFGNGGFGNVEVAFSELNGIKSEMAVAQYASTGSTGNPFGNARPQTVTLTRRVDGGSEIWAWHMDVLGGKPSARKDCLLKLLDASGKTLLTFVMGHAWPSKVEIAGVPSGESQDVMETYEFVCDSIDIQPG